MGSISCVLHDSFHEFCFIELFLSQDIRKELEQHVGQINDLSAFGDKVASDPSIHELEGSLVLNEKVSLETRWKNLNATAVEVQDR